MGVESDEYTGFPFLNRNVIKPAIKEINDLTDYFVEVEQKRIRTQGCRTEVPHHQNQEALRSGVGVPGCRGPPPLSLWNSFKPDVDRAVALEDC